MHNLFKKFTAYCLVFSLFAYITVGYLPFEPSLQAASINITCSGQTITQVIGVPGADEFNSGDDVTLTGTGTCILSGASTFGTLTIGDGTNATVLTHAAEDKVGVDITVTTLLDVKANSSINVDAKGCTYNKGPDGNGDCATSTAGAGANASGGAGGAGYGGAGANGDASSGGATYGSATDPLLLGSGGGQGWDANGIGGAGGGLIKISSAGTVMISGTLTANGGEGSNIAGNRAGGGGSGGSINIQTATLTGSGTLSANGGNAYYNYYRGGTGGGGRIAVYFSNDSKAAAANILVNTTANAGVHEDSTAYEGDDGTIIFTYDPNDDSSPLPDNYTASLIDDDVIKLKTGFEFDLADTGSLTLDPSGLEISDLSNLTTTAKVQSLTIVTESADDALVTEKFTGNTLTCNTNTTTLSISTAATAESTGNTVSCSAAATTLDGNVYSGSTWNVGTWTVSSLDLNFDGAATLAGTVSTTSTSASSIDVVSDTTSDDITFSGASFTAPATGAADTNTFNIGTSATLSVTGSSTLTGNMYNSTLASLIIDTGSSWNGNVILSGLSGTSSIIGTLSANAHGCSASQGPNSSGVCTNNGSGADTGGYGGEGGDAFGSGGGGYGGVGGDGGAGGSQAGGTYGDSTSPVSYGSGGGTTVDATGIGGAGGGIIRLISSGTIAISGVISANGGSGSSSWGRESGGGSGGSIYLNASTLSGSGSITANGGSAITGYYSGGSGGGGRIAFLYASTSGAAVSNATVSAGSHSNGSYQGSNGSLYSLELTVPDTPSVTSPTTSSYNNSINPSLTSSSYSSNGATHSSSDWKITTDSGGSSVVWSATADATNLESITVNTSNGTFSGGLSGASALASYTTYYAFVRYTNGSGSSSWSSGVAFTTLFTGNTATQVWDFNEAVPADYYSFSASYVGFTDSIASLEDLGGGTYYAGGVDGDIYRQVVTVSNAGSAISTVSQQKITVTYTDNMQADFDDLRFTDSSVTELDYWVESYVSGTSAIVWVELPSIASGDNTVYMYYGNASATSESSISAVFTVDSIYAQSGDCPSGNSNCNSMDNHTEAIAVRALDVTSTTAVTKVDWGSIALGSAFNSNVDDYFYDRTRFIFYVPAAGESGTWSFAVDSDDGSEFMLNPGDIDNPTGDESVVASYYGAHGACSCTSHSGSVSLTAGEGVWGDFLMNELSGGEAGRLYAKSPSGSFQIVNTSNFSGYLYSRNYVSGVTVSVDVTEQLTGAGEANSLYPTIGGDHPSYTQLFSISNVLGGSNEGSVAYQLSTDSSTWKYHDGSSWTSVSDDNTDNNTISELNSYIPAFPAASSIYFKVFLQSNGTQQVELDSITLNYLTDLSSITGFTVSSTTATTAALSWDTLSDYGFDHYEIWYGTTQAAVENRTGSAVEWDNDPDDAALANASTSTTTITGLTAGLTYYAQIWAVDVISQESYSDVISFNTNQTATLASLDAAQKTDGSNYLDVSFIADDGDDDDTLQVLVQYDVGGGVTKGTVVTTEGTLTATYGSPTIDNAASYQIGTTSGYITTSSGANTISFDLDLSGESDIDTTTAEIYLTVYDGIAASSVYTISDVTVDTIAPSVAVDVPAGTYSESQTVTLAAYKTSSLSTADSTATIYYTTDGTTPTTSNYDGIDTGSATISITGTTTVQYFAVDSYGNAGSVTSTLYTISGGTITVDIGSPAALLQTSASTIDVTVTSSDSNNNTITGVTVNGVEAAYSGGQYTAGIPISGADGSFAITAIATNNLSETGSAAINIIRDTTAPDAPTVSTTTSATSNATLVIGGTAVYGTYVYVNGTIAATPDASNDWTYSASLSSGTNSFSFTTRDVAGNESDATSYSVGYDSDNPLQSISLSSVVSSLPQGSSVNIIATGTYYDETTADLTSLVTFINSNDVVGTISNGIFQSLAAGITSISVSLNDIASDDLQLIVNSLGGGGGGSSSSTTDAEATPTPSTSATATPEASASPEASIEPNASPDVEEIIEASEIPSPTPTPIERLPLTSQPPIPEFVTPTPKPVVVVPSAKPVATSAAPKVPVVLSSSAPVPVIIDSTDLEKALEESLATPEPTPFVVLAVEDVEPAPALSANLETPIVTTTVVENPQLLTTLIGFTVVNDMETADEFEDCIDSDGDGVCDFKEELLHSDPHDATVVPQFEKLVTEGQRTLEVPQVWKKAYRMEDADLQRGDLDSDGDGISNIEEMELGTNPRSADTDGDGISDGLERNVYNTNMLRATKLDEVVAKHPNTNTLKNNTRLPSLDMSITGTAPVGSQVNLYVVDENNVRTKVGTTRADANNSYLIKPIVDVSRGDSLKTSALSADDNQHVAQTTPSFLKDGVYKVFTETVVSRSQAEYLLRLKNGAEQRRDEYLRNDFKDMQNMSLILEDGYSYLKFSQPINIKDTRHYVKLTHNGFEVEYFARPATIDEYYSYWLDENLSNTNAREQRLKKAELDSLRGLGQLEKRTNNPIAQEVASLIILDYANTAQDPGKYTLFVDRGIRSLFGTVMTTQQTSFSFMVRNADDKRTWKPASSLMASALQSDMVSFTSEPVSVVVDSSVNQYNPVPEVLDTTQVTSEHIDGDLTLDADSDRPVLTAQLSIPDISGATSVVANWQSLLLTSSIIADSQQGDFKIFAPGNLEPGEHTVYIHSIRAEGDEKVRSADIRLKFVVSGPLYSNPYVIGGGIFTVLLLITIAVLRRRKSTTQPAQMAPAELGQ